MCISMRTAALAASALCVASHITARISPCGRVNSFASWIRFARLPSPHGGIQKPSKPWALLRTPRARQLRKLSTPRASLLSKCGHDDSLTSRLRHVRRFRWCVGSHIIRFNQTLHLARTRGGREMASTPGRRWCTREETCGPS